jgi:beta-xylosidase
MNWPKTDFKWAPSVVEFKGKYYMYSSVPCQVWAAVADSPLGPWTNLVGEGKPMIPDQTPKETITLDGECFIDDDGQAHLWYGTWWRPTMVKLKPDMRSFDGEPIQYFKNPSNPNPPRGLVQRCMEGP